MTIEQLEHMQKDCLNLVHANRERDVEHNSLSNSINWPNSSERVQLLLIAVLADIAMSLRKAHP